MAYHRLGEQLDLLQLVPAVDVMKDDNLWLVMRHLHLRKFQLHIEATGCRPPPPSSTRGMAGRNQIERGN